MGSGLDVELVVSLKRRLLNSGESKGSHDGAGRGYVWVSDEA